MADSKTKKTTPASSAAKKTATKKPTTNVSKAANKTGANKTAANKATSESTSVVKSAASSEKPTNAKSTSQAKPNKNSSAKAELKKSEKTTAKPTASNPAASSKAAASSKKEKRSGSGIAFLALLFSLGALGLSGYNFYLQNLSSQSKQSRDSLLTGINQIKSNVTEFGTVVTGLQQEVHDFKASQAQYITEDTLTTVVKESVDNAVQNLPELPNIGPKLLESDTDISDTKLQNESAVDGQETQDSSVENTKQADQITTGDSEKAANDQTEDDSFWSWNRAKKDIKGMLNSFIKIEKTDQN